MNYLALTTLFQLCGDLVNRCNISDALAGMNNMEEATGWAERGLKVSIAGSGQECDEGCGVILYNLGMLHEVSKKAQWFLVDSQHGSFCNSPLAFTA